LCCRTGFGGGVTVPGAKNKISSEQRARFAEKAELIRQIFKAAQTDMRGGHVSPESQRWLLESLYQVPLEQIRSMGTSGTFSGTVNAMTQTKSKMVAKVFGDTNQDSSASRSSLAATSTRATLEGKSFRRRLPADSIFPNRGQCMEVPQN